MNASNDMAEATWPTGCYTPPRSERIERLNVASQQLGDELLWFAGQGGNIFNSERMIRAAGSYCTLAAMQEYVNSDSVSQAVAERVNDEFVEFGEHACRSVETWRRRPQSVGALAEIAVLKVLYSGVADGFFRSGFAFLRRTTIQNPQTGLPSDIDIIGRVNEKTTKLQVKALARKETFIYKPGIKVVSTQGLIPAKRRGDRLMHLFGLHRKPPESREEVYSLLAQRLK